MSEIRTTQFVDLEDRFVPRITAGSNKMHNIYVHALLYALKYANI